MSFKTELPKRAVFLFSLGGLLTVFLGIFAFNRITALDDILAARALNYDNVRKLEALNTRVLDLETGQRGFEITGDRTFLEPYESARTEVEVLIDDLGANLGNDPAQLALLSELHSLIERQIELGDSAVERRKNQVSIGAQEALAMKELMDRVRWTVQKLKDREQLSLNARIQDAKKGRFFTRVLMPLGAAVGGALIAAGLLLVRRSTIRSLILREELRDSKERAVEASNLKSAFLANMSHEIRTPMNGVLGLAEVLSKTDLDETQKNYVSSIQRSALSLLSLINGILDLSKIESGKLELESTYFEIETVVNDAVDTVALTASAKGVKLEKFIDSSLPRAYMGDPTRLRQVLINLLNNAVKFTAEGSVRFSIRGLTLRGDKITTEVEIKDEGIGMTPETQARLFTPFSQGDESTTRQYGGTGLGLSIVKEIVSLMKGSVELKSELGVGTTVTVTFPLTTVPVAKKVSAVGKSKNMVPESERLKILVVEDNLINQQVVRAMLKGLGHHADFANDGLIATDVFKRSEYDLILMDCQMPVMDGFEATRQIRAHERASGKRSQLPIIAITASAVRGDLEACLISGMNDFISKPMTMTDLSTKLELWSPKARRASPQVVDPEKTVNDGLRAELETLIQKLHTFFDAREFQRLGESARELKQLSSEMGFTRLKGIAHLIESGWQTAELKTLEFQLLQLSIESDLAVRHLNRTDVLTAVNE